MLTFGNASTIHQLSTSLSSALRTPGKIFVACLMISPALVEADQLSAMGVNSALTLWSDHKEWIIFLLAALLVQAVAIAILMVNRHRQLKKDLIAAKQDVQHQQRMNEQSLQSKALIQKVIDASPDWIFVKDEENRFLIVNEPFAKAFHETPQGLVGRVDSDFIPKELCEGDALSGTPGLHDYDKAVFRGETVHIFPEKISLEGDRPRVFDTFKTPLRDADQRIFGNLCYRRDVTERFNREQDQKLLERQLQQAQKMEIIGHLTGGVAHDFNNILASILGHTELIQITSEADLKPEVNRYLREILQAGIRGKELVQQLLTVSQKRETAASAIFVQPIIKEVVKLLQSTLPASISISFKLEKDLPQVLLSPVQLHQVLMNLGVNARDSISGVGHVEILATRNTTLNKSHCETCHGSFQGDYVCITVQDTGSGVSDDDRGKIFDPFFTTKAVGSGSGLGLSVLHGIVHSVEGHIELETEVGRGSRFTVFLPAHEQMQQQPSSRRKSLPPSNSNAFGHIMVVDDEPGIVGVLKALFENAGYTVSGFTSSVAALDAFKAEPGSVDLVITDLTMPHLTGVELAREILITSPDKPIVLCTGYSSLIDETSALKLGIRRFLLKPVPSATILEAVAHCLRTSNPINARL